MTPETTPEILNTTERASDCALTLHGILLHEGLPHHARLAWMIHEQVEVVAEAIGAILEVDVQVK